MIPLSFDIDGVLANGWPLLSDELRRRYNVNCGINEPRTFLLEKILPLTQNQIWECVDGYIKRWNEVEPVEGALDFLTWYLNKTKNTIYIITSRPEYLREYTTKWIERFIPPHKYELYFSSKDCPKSVIMDTIDSEILIEDRLKYATEVAERGKVVILLDKTYNRDDDRREHPFITVADDWSEVGTIYESLIKIFGGI